MGNPRIRVVVSGGIGSGKSTVSRMMGELGAVVIEADAVGHEVLEPGGAAFTAVAERWPAVVVDGRIDRARLAAVVFTDEEALRELEQITHPAIGARVAALVAEAGDRDVVVELPLTVDLLGPDWIRVVVDASPELRARRAEEAGWAADDVERRMAAQPGREEWLAGADAVLVNDGDLASLRTRVEELWRRLGADQGRPIVS
jgi:dephospho-CoA kinase